MKLLLLVLSLVTATTIYSATQGPRNARKVEEQWNISALWTREYVNALSADLPNLLDIEQRLTTTTTELGEALIPYYGKKVGHELSALLLSQQILTLELIKIVLKNDPELVKDSENSWKQGAMKVSNFIAKINPYISFQAARDLLFDAMVALVTMTKERHAKKWKEEIRAYDQFREKNAEFARLLFQALENAFPKKVRTLAPKQPKPTPFGLPPDVTLASQKSS